MVFFDSGSAELNSRARAIIGNAAQAMRTLDVRRIRVTGAADRQGSSAYNLNLSRRRAEAVREALIGQGISAEAIVIEAQGEGRPLVETVDGVAEPQNRFAAITMIEICRPLSASGVPTPAC
jgi:OOP family OmpA-OmpF porin